MSMMISILAAVAALLPAQSGFARMPVDPSLNAPPQSAAWVPFISPMNIFHEYWFVLLLPMAIGVSWVYKAYRILCRDQTQWGRCWATLYH